MHSSWNMMTAWMSPSAPEYFAVESEPELVQVLLGEQETYS